MPFSLVSVVYSLIEHLQLDGFPVSESSIHAYPHLHVCEVHDGVVPLHMSMYGGIHIWRCECVSLITTEVGSGSSDVAAKLNKQRKER